MKQVQALELKNILDSGTPCTMIDVREPYELEICSLAGAKNVPMAHIPAEIDRIPSNGLLVIVCKSGNRAMAVANLLEMDYGRSNVHYLEGGILAWISAVQPHLETY